MGNPNPDLDGHVRPGNNLFTDSIVALHASDGSLAWSYQEVHHGLYLLNRATGKPVHPIPEVPVPQNRWQKTSATQPEPSETAFVPHACATKGFPKRRAARSPGRTHCRCPEGAAR